MSLLRGSSSGEFFRVLVVADDPLGGPGLARWLDNNFGATIETDASHALRLLLHPDHFFDVVLFDMVMPLHGLELCRRVADTRPEQAERMVLVTGAAPVPAVPHLRVLRKPIEVSALRREIRSVATQSGHRETV